MQQLTDTNLKFLVDKIHDIKVALFKPEMHSELKLPNNIIQVIKTDNSGNVYFFTSCMNEQAKNLEKCFYAYLDFYKKGSEERLKISGKASIVSDEELTHILFKEGLYSAGTAPRLVLIKLNILQAEFSEARLPVYKDFSLMSKIKSAFLSIFFTPSHRQFDFS